MAININPKMKGKFTAEAKKRGLTAQQYARKIKKRLKGNCKTKKEVKLLKQAVFALNSKKFKKRKTKRR